MEKQWTLESIGADGAHVDFVIAQLPCHVGRNKDNDLVIGNLGLSREHAIITRDISGQLKLIDDNSTNGTIIFAIALTVIVAVAAGLFVASRRKRAAGDGTD